jgi:hypothetical protein
MKIRPLFGVAALAGLFAVGSTAMAADQGSTGGTSGPAAGSTVKPPAGQGGTAGIAGPAGSKNGPAQRPQNAQTAEHGTATDAAGVAGAPGSKSGPAQHSGSAEAKK